MIFLFPRWDMLVSWRVSIPTGWLDFHPTWLVQLKLQGKRSWALRPKRMHHDLKVDDVPHGGERRTCFGGKGYRTDKKCLNFNKFSWTLFEIWVSLAFLTRVLRPKSFPKAFWCFWIVQVVAGTDKNLLKHRGWAKQNWPRIEKNMSKKSSGFKPVIQWLQATSCLLLEGKRLKGRSGSLTELWKRFIWNTCKSHISVCFWFSLQNTLSLGDMNLPYETYPSFIEGAQLEKPWIFFSWLLTCHWNWGYS